MSDSMRNATGKTLIVFGAGLVAGAVYWALRVTSPAPPPVSLVGLLGILVGEAVVSRALRRRRARKQEHPPLGHVAPGSDTAPSRATNGET